MQLLGFKSFGAELFSPIIPVRYLRRAWPRGSGRAKRGTVITSLKTLSRRDAAIVSHSQYKYWDVPNVVLLFFFQCFSALFEKGRFIAVPLAKY